MKRSRKHMATASALLPFDNPDPFMICQPAQLDTLCSQVTAKSYRVALGLSALIVQTVFVGCFGCFGFGNKEHMVPINKDLHPPYQIACFGCYRGGNKHLGGMILFCIGPLLFHPA